MNLRRGDGFWTIAEHLSHLAQVQPMLMDRLVRFRDEHQPEFIPYIPGDDEPAGQTPPLIPAASALEQFSAVRQEQLALLSDGDDSFWGKQGIHPEYEQYSSIILTRHMLMHDYWHMYRMEELWLTLDAYLTHLEG